MNKDLLVKILTGPEKKLVGTGYPVAKDRILTVRHLFDEQPDSIWVQWRTEIDPQQEARSASLIWSSANSPQTQALDAAVLETCFPPAMAGKTLPVLLNRRPETAWSWESEGYGRVGNQSNGDCKPVAMSGEMYAAATNDPTFSLGVRYHTTLVGGWKGVSGSPVFYQDKIIGAIVDSPGHHANSRLGAVPIWKLRENKEFCHAILADSEDRHIAKLREKIANLTEYLPDFQNELRECLFDGGCSSSDLINILLNRGPEDFLQEIRQICVKWDEDGWPARVPKSKICDIVFSALPIIFGQDIVENLNSQRVGINPGNVSGATTMAGAEIAMARRDGRAVKFEKSEACDKLPLATYAIPTPPANELESNQNGQGLQDIVHLEQFLVSKFANHGPGWDIDDKRLAVNKVLESRSKIKQSWYYPFWEKNISGAENSASFFRDASQRFSNLLLVPLGGDVRQKMMEGTIPDHLSYFVYLHSCE